MFLSLLLLGKIQTSGILDVPWEEWGVLGPHELIGSSWVTTDFPLLLFLLTSFYSISIFCELQELLLSFLVMKKTPEPWRCIGL